MSSLRPDRGFRIHKLPMMWLPMDCWPSMDLNALELIMLRTSMTKLGSSHSPMSKMKLSSPLFLLIICSISACATHSEIYLPDGTKGHNISCDGALVGMDVCYKKASRICGSRGYQVAETDRNQITKSIMIRCGREDE